MSLSFLDPRWKVPKEFCRKKSDFCGRINSFNQRLWERFNKIIFILKLCTNSVSVEGSIHLIIFIYKLCTKSDFCGRNDSTKLFSFTSYKCNSPLSAFKVAGEGGHKISKIVVTSLMNAPWLD